MNLDELPNQLPAMASHAEVRYCAEWVERVFSDPPDSANQRSGFLSEEEVPFSFQYGGQSTKGFLKEWRRRCETSVGEGFRLHEAHWSDPVTAFAVKAIVKVYEDYPAVDWVLTFMNEGTEDTAAIEDIQALDLVLRSEDPKAPFVVGHNRGDVFGESSFENIDTPLEPGRVFTMAPTGGRSSNGAFPFFDTRFGDKNVVGAIGWSGQWEFSADREDGRHARLRAGMQKTHLVLHPGEEIRTPRILLLVNSTDAETAHNRFRRLLLFHYSPHKERRPVELPIASQCFDRYSWTVPEWATEAGQVDALDQAAQLGFDTHWLDAAWFPGGFPHGVGNWYPKPEAFPRGLRSVADACHERGMKFVLWFEPERVAPNTQIAKEHPDFVLQGEESGLFRLDLREARRWLTDLLSGYIEEYNLDVYRNDFNIDPLSFWQANDKPDRQGMTEIRYVEGLYQMWDELLERHPGLLIDNCASGGRRIDLEMCIRSVPFWRSDTNCFPGNADWNPVHSAGISYYLPLHMACAWEADRYQVRAAATGGLICQWPYREEDFPTETARELLEEAKSLRKYWYGDSYRLSPASSAYEHWCAIQLHRPDLDEGVVLFFHRTKSPYTSMSVRLKGLEHDAVYTLERCCEESHGPKEEMKGEDLMRRLEAALPVAPSSLVVRYKMKAP